MASPCHVLIVAAGDLDARELVALARPPAGGAHETLLIVAADGGAARCLLADVTPDLVVGDLDSLEPSEQARLIELGIEFRVAASDKEESDLELCLLTALEVGAQRVTIAGALGVVRPEHSIANLLLLADPRFDGVEVAVVGRGSRITRIGTAMGPGELAIEGTAGDFVSLFPLGAAVEGVTTDGLRFPLRGEILALGPSRGLSNELLRTRARVSSCRGCLLVVHTSRAAASGPAASGRAEEPS